MITTIRTTVTINSSQVVHWGSEFGTMCGAGAGFGKKINDSQATTATCKRCVKLIALQVELAHAEALEQNMAVDATRRAVETADAITAHQIARAENMDRIISEDWDAAHDENEERAMATARNLDIWLQPGVVLVSPMLDGGLFTFEGWGRRGAEVREQRTGILHAVSQSYVTTWKYVPRRVDLHQVWRHRTTGALARIVDSSPVSVLLRDEETERASWLGLDLLAELYVWVPKGGA